MVDEELHASFKSWVALDGEVFLAHWSVARHLDRAAKTDDDPYELAGSPESGHEGELLTRYRFHLSVQGLLRRTMAAQQYLQDIVLAVARNPDLSTDDFAQVSKPLESVLHFLAETLETARSIRAPALLNVPAGTPLHALIVDRADRTLSPRSRGRITQEWVTKLAAVGGRPDPAEARSLQEPRGPAGLPGKAGRAGQAGMNGRQFGTASDPTRMGVGHSYACAPAFRSPLASRAKVAAKAGLGAGILGLRPCGAGRCVAVELR